MGDFISRPDEDLFAERLDELYQDMISQASPGEHKPGFNDPPIEDPELRMARKVLGLIQRVKRTESLESRETTDDAVTPQADHDLSSELDSTSSGSGEPNHIGRFVIQRQLGQGGYGMVFLAHDPLLERDVAIKVPRPEVVMTQALRQRFLREGKAAASLGHPNIVPVFEAGSAGPICYIAAKFVQGPTLGEWLRSQSPNARLEQRQAAGFVANLADALEHAHQRGVLHRDLKPANVLLELREPSDLTADSEERSTDLISSPSPLACYSPRITDFGMAKILGEVSDQTLTGTILGTPAYMSPEQTMAGKLTVDARTDVYSLGVILYELLVGRPPFAGSTAMQTMQQVQTLEPVLPRKFRPGVSPDLEAICLKCLEKSPTSRYASAYDLQQDLQRFLSCQSVLARPVSRRRQLARWAKRNPLVAGSLSLAICAIVIGLVSTTRMWLRAEQLRRDAVASQEQAVEKSRQLTRAVDDLLTAIAETPEVKVSGFEALRRKLLERANQFYVSFLSEQPDDPELQAEHANSLFRLAKIRAELGDRVGALELIDRLIGDLPPPDGRNASQESMLTQAMVLKARQHAILYDPSNTEKAIEAAIQQARDAFAASPQQNQARVDLAMALQGAADCLIQVGRRTEGNDLTLESVQLWEAVELDFIQLSDQSASKGQALVSAAQALATSEDKYRATPYADQAIQWLEKLARSHDNPPPAVMSSLGRVYQIRGFLHDKDFTAAQASFDRANEVLARLVEEHPLVPSYPIQLQAVAYSQALGYFVANRDEDDIREALQRFRENTVRCEHLMDRFPQEKTALARRLGDNLTMLGLCQGRLREFQEKWETLTRSRALIQELYDQSKGRADIALRLAGIDGDLGQCLIDLEQYPEALDKLGESEKRLREIIAADPENGQAARYLSNNYARSAEVWAQLGKWVQAVEDHQKSIDFYWSDKTDKYGQHSIYLLKGGLADEGIRKLEQFGEHALRQFQLETPGTDSYPLEVATTAADFLDGLTELEADTLSNAAIGEIRKRAIAVGLNGFAALARNPERSRQVIQELLDSPELTPLTSTPTFQQWQRDRLGLELNPNEAVMLNEWRD